MTSTNPPTKERRPFKVVPATLDDANAMGQISGDAFRTDSHTIMAEKWEGDFGEGCKEWYPDLISDPNMEAMVARDGVDGSGEVLGCIFWSRRLFSKDGTRLKGNSNTLLESEIAKADPSTISSKSVFPPPPPPVTTPIPPNTKLTLKELRASTKSAMSHYVALTMPEGVSCYVIYGISVAPAHQSRGIGSALLKYGTDKADALGVHCMVSSSMSGTPAFEKAGFVEVGRNELCLDDYAQGYKWTVVDKESGEKKEVDFGNYIWRWLVRDPK